MARQTGALISTSRPPEAPTRPLAPPRRNDFRPYGARSSRSASE
jgi:hypothetical protein